MIRTATFCVWKALSYSFLFVVVFSITSLSQNAIVTENALPGNPISEWGVPNFRDNSIAGFSTKMSLNRGQTVRFKINVQSAATFTLKIYRIGYYGGNGARLVANLGTKNGTIQPNGNYNSSTGELDCSNWSESANWVIPSTAVSGFYIAKLERTGGGSNHIAFIVRNDASTSDLYLQIPDATWQAYNGYGGNSLYDGTTSWPSGHAVKVSYNRPFFPYNSLFNTDGREADWYMNAEYPMIRWLERNGYDVSYTSCNDVANNGGRLLNHRVFVTVGHDEYWSKQHRQNVEAARNAGVHIAFFTGNEVYWKTRYENNDGTEDRTLVCYKEGFLADGTLGERTCGSKCDPSPEWTGLWRTGGNYDAGLPENSLGGQISWVENPAEIGVPAFYKNLRFWRNTSVANLTSGQTAFLGVNTLGYEWDYEQAQFGSSYPPGRITMSSRTLNNLTHKLSLYRHSSGALVFGAGTCQWSWGLDGEHWGGGTTVSTEMQQATVNLFADMGVQPGTIQAGLTSASQSADFTAPTATITSPANGSSFSSGATITFSGNASDGGGGVIGSVEVSVDGGSTWTAATINAIASTTSWSYTWTAGPNGTYNIRARGVDDSGNKGATGSGIAITVGSGGSDLTPPTVSSVSPTNGSTGVSVNTTIIASFSEAISSASVTTSTYQLRDAGNSLINASVSTSGNQITLTPTSALNASATYTVTITGGSSGVKDLAGNALVSNYNWSFTTGSGGGGGGTVTLFASTTTPDVPLSNDGQGISLGMRFRTTQNGFINGIRYYKGAGTTGSHTGHLWTNTGTQLAQATFTGETASGWQQVLFSSPVAVTAGVTYVAAYFSPSGDYPATKPYFTQAIVNGPLRGLADGEDGINGVYRYGATASFPNSGNLSSNYWVDVVFSSSSGTDLTPPTVTSVSPTSGATGVSASAVVIGNFSEAISSASVTSSTFQLRNPANTLITASVSTSGSQITLDPSASLASSTIYTATITGGASGVKDLAGNALASNFSWSFTTAAVDNTPPTVSSVVPASGATGISTGTAVIANFSESVNASTVTGSTYQLRDASNNLIAASVSTSGSQITLTPSSSLAASATYTATITGGASGVKDLAGNALANNFSWSFTTTSTTPPSSSVAIQSFDTKTGTAATVHSLTSVPAGALLVLSTTADAIPSNCLVSSSPALTWTKRVDAGATSSDNAEIWTAVYAAGGAISVTSSWGAGNSQSSVCYVVINAETTLSGAFNSATLQAAPSVTITTTRDNSILFNCTADWNSVDGTIRTFRDGATERLYYKDVNFASYHYTKTAATIASYTEGISQPSTQSASTSVLEIRSNSVTTGTAPSISTHPLSQTKCAGSSVTFTSAASGTPTPTVQWQQNTSGTWTNITGATSATLTFTTATADNNKQYRAVWTNSNGSVNSNSATLTVNAVPSAPTISVVNNCGSSTLTAATFTGSLLWNTGATTTSITVTASGTYTVTQTVNGCTSSPGSGVAAPLTSNVPAPTVSVTNNCNNSVLTAGSFTGTLLWSTGATTTSITVTTAGTYTVKQTVNGCSSPNGAGTAAPKPTPALSSNLSATATSGTAFTYTPTSTVAGTTFGWTRAAVAGISNPASSGTGAVSETLTNTTASPVNVTYVYTLNANGCTNTQNVVVTVNPVNIVNCTINGTSQLANFNSTSIPAGRYIWFNSSLNPGSIGTGSSTIIMDITNTVITFTASGQSYSLNVPNGRIRFDAAVTSATTQFVNGVWETVVPRSFSSNIFINGLAYLVPVNFPGNINNVRWTTNIKINRASTAVNWRWSAAVYTTFAAHSGINVKPISSTTQNPYPNSDAAGTPENFKSSLVGGARSTGGTNYTGSFVSSGSITCSTVGTRGVAEPLITKQTPADQIDELASDQITKSGILRAEVMPNPSSTFFNLAIRGRNDLPVTIKIMDIFGRVIERHERVAANTVLKVGSRWTNGSYYAEIIQGDQRKIIKILKAR